MRISFDEFNISLLDPTLSGAEIPAVLLSKLLHSFALEAEVNLYEEEDNSSTELKLRALMNSLVHENLHRQTRLGTQEKSDLHYNMTKLSEIMLLSEGNLDLVFIDKKMVIFTPVLATFKSLESVIEGLNALLSKTQGSKTWILDLSFVNRISFELFGYLIGLKLSLNRLGINLDLMWLKSEAVAPELTESMRAHFNLHLKGVFLLSRQVQPQE